MQNQLNVVNDYCFDWKLTLNAEKTKTVVFNKTSATFKLHQINFGGELIKTAKYFSYLEITLDSNGKFHTAINELSRKLQKLQGDYINHLLLITYPLKHHSKHSIPMSNQFHCFRQKYGDMNQKRSQGEVEKLFSELYKHLLEVHKKIRQN